jgi:hypothetical protein
VIPKYFKRNSRDHVLLLIAKSERSWFGWETAFKISNHFKDRRRTREVAQRLIEKGLLEVEYRGRFKDAYWRITEIGAKYLVAFARTWRSPYAL